ncbi:AfsR/SARP family transcriptional regulator [Kutzneria kofuensis]|uniref:DNA-binding SARP family transcriptional activator n=1 Tax=Kutzneria kofuensis TaxID=103725 RepID=A0A7W9NLN0_9PSEU|nr:AfsR/SARP family transcriptional regulator [Kutzneria kofuensis]MBB5896483.1 DNA-binding SARP family transcriptional activator [Kutzneria kofuensis]
MLEFTLLGPLGVQGADGPVQLTSTRLKQVCAILLVDSPRVVDVGRIVAELWPAGPPKSALSTVHTYVYLVRKQLAEHVADVNKLVATVSNGYAMTVDRQAVDAFRFEQCVRDGRVLLDAGRAADASAKFDKALAMWRGSALVDVRGGPLLDAEAVRLDGLREAALELRIQADLAQERLAEVIPELQALVRRYPLRERFHHQLVAALNRAGRRADALIAYRHTCRVLHEELGLDPSYELRRLHHLVLTGAPVGAAEAAVRLPSPL